MAQCRVNLGDGQVTNVPSGAVVEAIGALEPGPRGGDYVEDVGSQPQVVEWCFALMPAVISAMATSVTAELEEWEQVTQIVMMLLDSGAFAHVCPPTFATHAPIRMITDSGAKLADGRSIVSQGSRHVFLSLVGSWPPVVVRVDFLIMNVIRPILSVGLLMRKGFDIRFDSGRCRLMKAGVSFNLYPYSNLYYLPVRVLGGASAINVFWVGTSRGNTCAWSFDLCARGQLRTYPSLRVDPFRMVLRPRQ